MADITTPTSNPLMGNTAPAVAQQILSNLSSFEKTVWIGQMLHNYYELSFLGLITKKAPKIKGNQLIYNLAQPINSQSMTTKDFKGKFNPQNNISPSAISILMDEMEVWGFELDSIMEIQSSYNLLNAETYEAAQGVNTNISINVLKRIFASAGNTLGNVTINIATAYDNIVDMVTQLNWAKVPKYGRYIIVDPDYLGMLAKDPRFTSNPNVLDNGIVEGQKIAGAQVICTTFLERTPKTASTNAVGQAILIQNSAYAFGLQAEVLQECAPSLGNFNRGLQGYVLYGDGVLRPEGIVTATCNYEVGIPEGMQGVIEE